MPSKPRVLVLTPDFPPVYGGIQALMFSLVQHWHRVEAHVVTLDAVGAKEFDRDGAVKPRRARPPRLLGKPAAGPLLNATALVEAFRFRPHVTLSGHVGVAPAAWVIERIMRVPYIQYLYAKEVIDFPRLSAFAIRNAAGVVALSQFAGTLALSHGANPGRVRYIPPGVDLPARRPPQEREGATILVVSRLDDRYKGHDVLIRALPLIRVRVPHAELVVVGDGRLRRFYEQFAASLGVSRHVHFVGSLDEEERNALLDGARVFAMPSRHSARGSGEGFGIVYLEAAAHGLPVVAGNVAGARDAVVDEETGLLVDPADHVAVAEAISQLLTEPARAATLGRAGAERAKEFSWPSIAQRVETLLLETADGAR